MEDKVFFNGVVPPEIKKVIGHIRKSSAEHIRLLAKIAVLSASPSNVLGQQVESLGTEFDKLQLDEDTRNALLLAVIKVVTEILRVPAFQLKSTVASFELFCQENKIPEHFSSEINTAIAEHVKKAPAKSSDLTFVRQPAIDDLRWRVEVTITTTHVTRVIRPQIFLEITSSDGKITAMTMSIEKFSELRYAIAKALRANQEILQNRAMK
eukprot:comp24010_c0_seq1/m.59642 comp24010_c0_seq1/g.59642  ORF comp24010_c0_seq1/g.59642 comp24010_c0_seq1/m.59642 type:complete len:210 (+) comp24010_c0_seq1:37-666(+)